VPGQLIEEMAFEKSIQENLFFKNAKDWLGI
jgi:hypothetical protein